MDPGGSSSYLSNLSPFIIFIKKTLWQTWSPAAAPVIFSLTGGLKMGLESLEKDNTPQ